MSHQFRDDVVADRHGASSSSEPEHGVESLYRLEALLAYRESGRGVSAGQRLAASRNGKETGRGFFYGLICLGLISVLAAFLVPMDRRITGEAVVRLDGSSANGAVLNGSVVQVLLPEARRRELALGQPLRVQLEGFPSVVFEAQVVAIDDRALPFEDGQLILGDRAMEPRLASDRWVSIEARLEGGTSDDDLRGVLHDGMRGRAEVLVTSVPFVEHLVPTLGESRGGAS